MSDVHIQVANHHYSQTWKITKNEENIISLVAS